MRAITILLLVLLATTTVWAFDLERSKARTSPNPKSQYIDIINGKMFVNGHRVKDSTPSEVLKSTTPRGRGNVNRQVNITNSHVSPNSTRRARYGDKTVSAIKALKMTPKAALDKSSGVDIGFTSNKKINSRTIQNKVTIRNSTTDLGVGTSSGSSSGGMHAMHTSAIKLRSKTAMSANISYARRLLACVLLGILICASGCVGAKGARKQAIDLENDIASEFEEEIPYKNVTQYSDALGNMKDLLSIQQEDTIYLSVEPIVNQTANAGKIPTVITMMVESSINKMSGPNIILIPFNEPALQKYAHKNLYIIHGAITEYDASNLTGGRGGSASGYGEAGNVDFDGGVDMESEYQRSSLSVDFTLLDVRKRMYVTGLQVSNKMKIEKISKNQGLGFSVFGNGISINAQASHTQGEHSALRLLVELSMVELIGTYYKLPYWITVYDTDEIDESIQKKMREDFEKGTSREQAKAIQRLLGYLYDNPLVVDGIIGKKTKGQIRQFKRDMHISPANGDVTADLYLEMLQATADKFRNSSLQQVSQQ